MKLMITTIQDQDTDRVIVALNEQKFRLTRIGSTGGFLRQGNTTLLIGVEDDQVQQVIAVLEKMGERRTQLMPMATGAMPNGMALYNYMEVEVGGATIFIVDVDHFEQV